MASFDINSIPAMAPPPGQTSNFDNPETMHTTVLAVAIATIGLMTMGVAVRVFTKGFIMRDMKIEEYFAIVATAGIIMWDSIFIHVSLTGFSRHLWDVRAVNIEHLAYMNYLGEISNAIAMWAAKCSILFQLKRLFCLGQSRNAIFWSIYGLLFLNTAYHLAALFTFILQCTPREKTWKLWLPGQCINVAAATLVSGAVNLVLDLGILIAPIAIIFHLRLPMKQKFGISAVFGVGAFTCAIAAFGVVLRVPLLYDPDLTWIITRVGIWTMVEYCGTIVVGCMPSFPRFFLYLSGDPPPTTTVSGTGSARSRSRSRKASAATVQMANEPKKEPKPSPHLSRHSMGEQTDKNDIDPEVGIALTTSEVSFMDPVDIEREHSAAGLRKPNLKGCDLESGGRYSGSSDWSPLSSLK